MNLVRCEKGHFYDKDKHGASCPYCAQVAAAKTAQPPSGVSLPNEKQPAGKPEPNALQAEQPLRRPLASQPTVSQPVPEQQNPPCQTSPQASPFPASDGVQTDSQEDNCTIGYYSRVIGVEPVVGWLVCIEGEYRGESFKLKSGRNFIGRAANMDVVLSADHSISRFKHAAVIYEPRSRQFIVATGESRELCYLNGEVVLSNMKMNAYDILNLGATSLMLIPCCGERFSWEEGLKEES